MSVPQSTPDVLGAVLREVSFASAAYRWIEMGSPFRLVFDRPGLRGVHLIAAGACELVLTDGSVTALAAGDTVILPRGDDHELRSGRAATATSGFDLAARTPGARLRAGGPGTAATIVCGAFVAGDPGHPALRGLPRLIVVPGDGGRPPPWLAPYVEVLRQEAFDAGPGSDVVMARLSDALIARVLRETGPTDHPGWLAALRDPQLAAVLGALHGNLSHPWTLASLAAVAGLSRTAFTGRFARTVGEPPMRYLQSLRLHHARRLLRDERLTVAAVAARVGYTSDVAFTAAFRRVFGLPPAGWRRHYNAPDASASTE